MSCENFYKFTDRKKIVVFVPEKFADKILMMLSESGAGLIGNYSMCSFRTTGIGTFKPNEKAKPFSGIKKNLSYENEIALEMEFGNESLNKVIDGLLKVHPYDEPVYEIYNFKKRDKTVAGSIVNFKKNIRLINLIKLFGKNNTELKGCKPEVSVKRIASIAGDFSKKIIESAEFAGCDAVILESKNNANIYKI